MRSIRPIQILISSPKPVGSKCRIGRLSRGLESSTSSGDQVEDKYDQREHQQEVDQPAAEVEAETEEPQDQNDYKNCPEHRIPFQ